MRYLETRIEGKPRQHKLPRSGRVVVGRGRDCGVTVDHVSISRHHFALLLDDGGGMTVEDLNSRNGMFVAQEPFQRLEADVDQWFVAGDVLMVIRDFVNMRSQDSVGDLGQGEPDDDATPITAQATAPEPGSRRRPESVLARLGDQRDPEAAVVDAFEALAQELGPRTVALLVAGERGWTVRAATGTPLPSEIEGLLQSVQGTEARCVEVAAGPALFCPVITDEDGMSAWLLLLPWNRSTTVPGPLRLVRALCAWWLRIERRSAVNGSGEAPSNTLEAANPSRFLAASAVTRAVLDEVDRLARATLTVLISGETGTGKELLARRLHQCSPRADGPFVAVNCAAIPRELLEAELFGIERGVATGVEGRSGKFVQASGGTLLLDEVADMPLELQPKLLRALETGEITAVGAANATPVDVRIVAATHRDLREHVRKGLFREDLLYRLDGAEVRVPGLRERRDEILPLARRFARNAADDQGTSFDGLTPRAARCLLGYAWPGNVRQLRNTMARAVALADGPILDVDLLPQEIVDTADRRVGDSMLALGDDYRTARMRYEKLYFSRLLQRCGNNHSEAARQAGLSRSNLYRKLEELGLRPEVP